MKFITIVLTALCLFACNSKSFEGKQNISEVMQEGDILKLRESAPKLIGKDWMLITSGTRENFNMMTASWGGLGELWYKPVVFIFVRPQRYTYEFVENNEYFTLTFFEEEYRDVLNMLGTKSGRNIDKMTESGLTPLKTDNGVAFGEGKIVMECRKLYAERLKEEAFIDKSNIDKYYEKRDFHKMYVAEIVKVWRK